MSEKPAFGQRVAEGAKLEQVEDYGSALRTIRAARVVFLLVLVFSLLIHIGAYAAVRWGGILGPRDQTRIQLDTPGAEITASALPDADKAERSSGWHRTFEILLPLGEFLGFVCCALLALCFLLTANVCLSAGLGGVRGCISAFFWTLVLLALLFPWGRWLDQRVGGVQVPGVYSTLEEFRRIPATFPDTTSQVLHYVRFLVYPLLALYILLMGNSRFARGSRLVQRHLETRTAARI